VKLVHPLARRRRYRQIATRRFSLGRRITAPAVGLRRDQYRPRMFGRRPGRSQPQQDVRRINRRARAIDPDRLNCTGTFAAGAALDDGATGGGPCIVRLSHQKPPSISPPSTATSARVSAVDSSTAFEVFIALSPTMDRAPL
jgi:hypothetical protein